MPSRRHQIDLPHRIHQKPGLGKLLPFATEKKQVSPWKSMGKNENLHRGHRGLKRGRVTNFCRRFFFPNPCEFTISICTKDGSKAFCSRTHRPLLHEHSFLWLFDSQLATRVFSACCQCPEVWQPATHALYVIKSSDTQVSTAIHRPNLEPATTRPYTKSDKNNQKYRIHGRKPKSYLVLPSFHSQISYLHIIHDLQSLFVHSSFCHSTDNAAKADAVGLLLFALVFAGQNGSSFTSTWGIMTVSK